MNKILLSGRLTKDVELRALQNNNKVAHGTIAVRRDFKENGEYKTDFIDYVAFNNQADYLDRYTKKGDLIELSGRWQVRNYQDKSGKTQYVNEVVIESVSSLTPKEKPESAPTYENIEDIDTTSNMDDLPF